MATAVATKSETSKKTNKPKSESWPEKFTNGVRQRKAFTAPYGIKNPSADQYVTYVALDAETLDAFKRHTSAGDAAILRWVVAGYNSEQRLNASLAERKVQSMVKTILSVNPKLSRSEAEKRARAAFA